MNFRVAEVFSGRKLMIVAASFRGCIQRIFFCGGDTL